MKRKGRNLETVKFGNVEMKIYCRRKTIKRKLKDGAPYLQRMSSVDLRACVGL